MLLGVAIGVDRLSGNSPSPDTRRDTLFATACFLGMFALYLPALVTQPVQRMWAGLRPATPDGLPIMGRDPDTERLWYATGHGRNGILHAALTGEIMADLLTSGVTDVDIGPFRVDRFQQ